MRPIGDPNVKLPPADYTTRTDGVGDVNVVDLGFHYPLQVTLTVRLVDANGVEVDPNKAHGSVVGGSRRYPRGDMARLTAYPDSQYWVGQWTGTDNDASTRLTNVVTMTGDKVVTVRFAPIKQKVLVSVVGGHGSVEVGQPVGGTAVQLIAHPDSGYRVRRWTGTDTDPSWNQNVVTVLLDRARTVTVEFELAKTQVLNVPSGYATIQAAIDAANPGDTRIVVSPGVHSVPGQDGIDLHGKRITIASTDPNDPAVVANTIIDCGGTEYSPARAFHFQSGEGPETILDGLTIKNGFMRGSIGAFGRYGILTPVPYILSDPTNANSPPIAEPGRYAQGDSYGARSCARPAALPSGTA